MTTIHVHTRHIRTSHVIRTYTSFHIIFTNIVNFHLFKHIHCLTISLFAKKQDAVLRNSLELADISMILQWNINDSSLLFNFVEGQKYRKIIIFNH